MKGHQGSSLLGVAKNVYINKRAEDILMAHPFKQSLKSNIIVQLIEGTHSYSVNHNIRNGAVRKVMYHGDISLMQ